MSKSKAPIIAWSGICVGLALWLTGGGDGTQDPGFSPDPSDSATQERQEAFRQLTLPEGEEVPDYTYAPVAAPTEEQEELDEGLIRLESGDVVFTRERAIREANQAILVGHMPTEITFVASYSAWPEELTEETSAEAFGRMLTGEEIAAIEAIHDEYLPDLLAYASLMRADYSEILSTVVRTQSYNLEIQDPTQDRPRSPRNHNVITMPGWRVTYPVGYDTYPHLKKTSDAAHSLRRRRDYAVSAYLANSK